MIFQINIEWLFTVDWCWHFVNWMLYRIVMAIVGISGKCCCNRSTFLVVLVVFWLGKILLMAQSVPKYSDIPEIKRTVSIAAWTSIEKRKKIEDSLTSRINDNFQMLDPAPWSWMGISLKIDEYSFFYLLSNFFNL